MSRTEALVAWWRALQPEEGGGDRAVRARLRRCASVAELMLEPDTMALFRRMGGREVELPTMALAAGVMVTLRSDAPNEPVARQVGPSNPEAPETALLKPLRFRRLMEAEEDDERLLAFRRLVLLADGRLNAHDLADALLNWTPRRRQRWIYHYWNAGAPPAPPPA